MAYSILTHQNKDFIIDHYHFPGVKRMAQYAVYVMMSPLYRMAARVWRKPQSTHRYKLSIVACFKNEAPYMKEWIEYHRLMGFDHFYLYNNNSDDDYQDVLHPYVEAGVVTLTDWPQVPVQLAAYEDFYARFRHETQWVSFIDLDEFFCPLRDTNMIEWLDKRSNYPLHMVYWQMFGTSGHMTHDFSRPVTEQYTVAWPKLDSIGKLLYNTDYDIVKFSRGMMHSFEVKAGPFNLPPMNQFGRIVIYDIHISDGKEREIQLNHYWSKSFSNYEAKHSKGSAAYGESWKTYDKFLQHEHFNTSANYGIFRFMVELKRRLGVNV